MMAERGLRTASLTFKRLARRGTLVDTKTYSDWSLDEGLQSRRLM